MNRPDSFKRGLTTLGRRVPETELTISAPEAGRRLGIKSRGTAYEAAHRGDIPTIKIGRLLRVPVRALEKMLDNVGAER